MNEIEHSVCWTSLLKVGVIHGAFEKDSLKLPRGFITASLYASQMTV